MAVAFADSSIVVLALPDLYGAFDTSIEGVAWVITSYNLVVAVGALALVPVVRRADAALVARIGLGLFLAASVGCAASWSLSALIAFRCLQGVGAALLLAGALPLLAALTSSPVRGTAAWATAGTLGIAVGPALGGVLTQLFDWRAIFVAQAPVAGAALLAVRPRGPSGSPAAFRRRRQGSALLADLGLALVFGALVGALFLSVLLVITVWGLSPIAGAGVVSALPVAAIAARPLARHVPPGLVAFVCAVLLAAGLVALALLPRVSDALVAVALALCGLGLGLAVPVLTRAAVDPESADARSGALTVGARHVGLVLALVVVAPLLSSELERGGQRALLAGTRVILDGSIPLTKKVPIALDLRDALEQSPKGEVPDLAEPFDRRGAGSDARLRRLRDSLVVTLEGTITRSFRSSFAVAALFAALAAIVGLRLRKALAV